MKVFLSHVPNIDIRNGGYWSRMKRPLPKRVNVASLKEASLVCREYIEKYELGGGNWTGGEATGKNNKPIADISYNGRIWALDGKEVKE